MDRPWKAILQFINFAGLESHLSDKVYAPRASTLRSDHAKRGRIKILSRGSEIGMVQDVEERGLHLKLDAFRDRNPLCQTHVVVDISMSGEAVHGEIAECTRSGSGQ